MKSLVFFTLLFAIAIGFSLALDESASVTIWWLNYRVDFSLVVLAVVVVVSFIFCFFGLKTISAIVSLPYKVSKFSRDRAYKKKIKALSNACISYLQEDYREASLYVNSYLTTKVQDTVEYNNNVNRVLCLIGVLTARKQKNKKNYYAWLQKLATFENKEVSSYRLSVLFEAEDLIAESLEGKAIELLSEFLVKNQNSYKGKLLFLKALAADKQWEKLLHQSRLLEKQDRLLEILLDYKRLAVEKLLKGAGSSRIELRKIMSLINKNESKDPTIASLIATKFTELNETSECLKVLESALNVAWNVNLGNLFLENILDSKSQLRLLDRWLIKYEGDYHFHLIFGLVCKKEKLWAKAKEQLEYSIKIKETSKAYVGLAQMAEQNESTAESYKIWKKAAKLNMQSI
ncbi:MAG: hypothetical protein CBC42_04760 [Betaproteobacteria bacterium TMED82]|nr:MAG: hypothetical protein CBC42_04760 [Betaproteobacteria bacterium TMED82]|tara:strand:+ start:4298 stop:5506 length:1209 start_codon:yes stop_codon:yes gene_type:complete